ncbi:MAG: VanZ family protein [Bacteroidota bacterium]
MKQNRTLVIVLYIAVLFGIAVFPFKEISYRADHTYYFQIRLDHIYHILFFSPWMSIGYCLFTKRFNHFSSTLTWFIFGLLLASCTEGIQFFLSYRTFTLLDLLSNFSGVIISWLVLPLTKRLCNKVMKRE